MYGILPQSRRARTRLLTTAASAAFAAAFCLGASRAHAADGEAAADAPMRDEIVVESTPFDRKLDESISPVVTLGGEELEKRAANTIGETLRLKPGISSSFFGPGASRPVIRGQSGVRVQVLNAGLPDIDASAASDDHAVAQDPVVAQQIEVIRGPAQILFGSSASGGVVNVIDGRIPDQLPEDRVDGSALFNYSTVDNGVGGGVSADIAAPGDNFVLHGDFSRRSTGDYDIPGVAFSRPLRNALDAAGEDSSSPSGELPNSDLDVKSWAMGGSYLFDRGFFGLSYSRYNTNYGVPEGPPEVGAGPGDAEPPVRIDLRQKRVDARGEIENLGFIQKLKLRAQHADYRHAEIPGGVVGTTFLNDGWNARIEGVTQRYAGMQTGFGVQYSTTDFSTVGDEQLVPPNTTEQIGLFALQDYYLGPWHFELGGRYENQSLTADSVGYSHTFNSVSVSGGVGVQASDALRLSLNGFRTERAPAAEEVLVEGAHDATRSFEIGDINLGKETSHGMEATSHFANDRFTGELTFFYTKYTDYIFPARTGAFQDGLPVFQFAPANATFKGVELQTTAQWFSAGGIDVSGDLQLSLVDAKLAEAIDGSRRLPHMPPLGGLVGVTAARGDALELRVEYELSHRIDRDHTSTFELPTDGFTSLNAFLTIRPFTDEPNLTLQIKGQNLTNEDIRYNTSFLKDTVPLPGRNVQLSARVDF